MKNSLISYLATQPTLKVIRGLMTSTQARHLRDLANEYNLSPSGVSDIIRRLKELNIVHLEYRGNKLYIKLNLNEQEMRYCEQFFELHEINLIRKRAAQFSINAYKKLSAMDEMYEFYKKVKYK